MESLYLGVYIRAARRNGLHRLELLATLTGETLYRKCGFIEICFCQAQSASFDQEKARQ